MNFIKRNSSRYVSMQSEPSKNQNKNLWCFNLILFASLKWNKQTVLLTLSLSSYSKKISEWFVNNFLEWFFGISISFICQSNLINTFIWRIKLTAKVNICWDIKFPENIPGILVWDDGNRAIIVSHLKKQSGFLHL